MVLSFLRGLSSEAELNRIIAKLAKLDTKPASKLAQSRWILPEGILTRLLKTARFAATMTHSPCSGNDAVISCDRKLGISFFR